AFNLGAIESLDDFEELSELVVRALDALLDYQDYPLPAAYRSTMNRRTLGVGVINFAYYLAKNGTKYSDGSANGLTHRTFEAMQYYLLKASVELAKEQGACPLFNETNYAKGLLPIDTYKKDIDL
ncbi:ribonucleotide-diphosphate reductase subunit alpha, partial [Vibrio campbellii]